MRERESPCVLRNIGSHCGISNGKNKVVNIMFYHFNKFSEIFNTLDYASIIHLTATFVIVVIPE